MLAYWPNNVTLTLLYQINIAFERSRLTGWKYLI